ncbi:NAD(P)H-binding protein [Amycolatopsis acidicola]|uniref:NAD(P)H-binding protein n=1 Tax=Amycolatopsis acidicola TaxID=2596893 RepID=A0A5N0V420_9PSEU|nr:NAD(P)H-binding protein [Amycolatopsis acidicola]KAA9159835.1 NAD(P)H-binding protein [Amycolatopsis acidicola]
MIVVTGATGNVGQPLVKALADSGAAVTAVSRKAAQVPAGVRHHQADLAEPDSLPLDGAEALFLLTSAEFLASGDLTGVLRAAGAAGVRRTVLLSSQGVGTFRHPAVHEEAVRQGSPEWTILRASGFQSNAFQWAESVRARREVAAPFGDVALPNIDPADIAAVAAAVLREPGHDGRTYTLTGPAPISPRQQAEAIGAAIGEPVRFIEQSREEARAAMLHFMPEPVAEATLDILGRPTPAERQVSPDVERVLGRGPRPFSGWAARFAPAFR